MQPIVFDPADSTIDVPRLLQHAVDEAARLLDADGAMLYLVDLATGRMRWVRDAGVVSGSDREWFRSLDLPVGIGMFGLAIAEGTVTRTDDYLADQSFPHDKVADRVAQEVGIRSMIVAPLMDGLGALGAVGTYSTRPAAFTDAHAALLKALADHAAVAVVNARLIDQLGRARAAEARRADVERALREIAARIAAIRDPAEVLQRLVDEAQRLLCSDGAQLSLMAEGRRHLTAAVMSGETDEETRAWLRELHFPLDGGMNGLAATTGQAVWTEDYMVDPRIPHEPDDQETAERLGLRGMAVAPLRGPENEVIGTLAVSYREPRRIGEDEIGLLQAFADQAAIAVANARLYDELRRSEERHRYLLEHSPDLVWSTDAEGRFTLLSEACERMTGWKPQELIGKHFGVLVHPNSAERTEQAWAHGRADPSRKTQYRLDLRHRDGHAVRAEVHAVAFELDGRFAGAHGSLRDMTEHDRLEHDLRQSAAERAAEWERANLARELHDSVTQALFSMTLTTRSIEMLLQRDPDAAARKLMELRELQRDALAEMRALIFELRPASLETDGLAQALRTHAAAVQGRTGLPVRVEADHIERLPLDLENALYRIAQEALHNVVKHASASGASIRLGEEAGTVRMAIEDDGHGFDQAAVPSGHLGLIGMRTRAERIQGTFAVTSRPGQGTRVEVVAPVPERRTGPIAAPAAGSRSAE